MKIRVKVVTHSSQSLIEAQADSSLKVKLKSTPIKGKANEELIALLAKHYQIPKSQIEIIHGLAAKNKIVEMKHLN